MNTFNLGTNVQRCRLKLHMSIADLAASTGISGAKLRKLERGEYKDPNLSALRLIATVLGVDLDILFMDYLHIYQHVEVEEQLDQELLNLYYTLPLHKQEYILERVNSWLKLSEKPLATDDPTTRSIYADEIEWLLSQSTPEEQERIYDIIRKTISL